MSNVKNKLLVMSGKGGVGKTTVAVNLAYSLSANGKKVGLLDADLHGPNVPSMLGIENEKLSSENDKIKPVEKDGLKVLSLDFMAKKNDAIIWRGPLKHKVLKQFIDDVEWGELDYLIVDFPPGTGDEQMSIAELITDKTGAIIVSTPQKVAIHDALKAIDFCHKMNVPITGIIENMSGDIFGKDTIEKIAKDNGMRFLGKISLNKNIVESGENGKPFVGSGNESDKEFENIIMNIIGKEAI